MDSAKCMPTPPDRVGREFVRQYYIIMNKSPENLHRFYTPDASFTHDDVDPSERRIIQVESRDEIRDAMLDRIQHFKHTSTRIESVDTVETLASGLLVQINGEISFNEQPMRSFSQSFILVPKSPFQYFVQNDLFHFCDYDDCESQSDTTDQMDKESTRQMEQEDWGTQCEEYIEPYDENNDDNMPRETTSDDGQHQNEVKLDNSDSGLSSDAEKQIMDIQSNNLKNMLQDQRSVTMETVTKRTSTPPARDNEQGTFNEPEQKGDDISEKQTQMFRDSCILTINNVINPNLELEDGKGYEAGPSENDKTQESFDGTKCDETEHNNGKSKYRKRKERKALKVSFDELIEEIDSKDIESESQTSQDTENLTPEKPTKKSTAEKSDQTTTEKPMPFNKAHTSQDETPRTVPEMKKQSYADLARAGNTEWIDVPTRTSAERMNRRPSMTVSRRNSRNEKTTPPKSTTDSLRTSPKNDHLQVFVGNIPHGASEEDIRKMFSRFGQVTRIRLHVNNRKPFLPHYAFITYDTVQAVKQCLKKKSLLTWDGHKLNVNGDATVDVSDDVGNQKSGDAAQSQGRDLKMFSKNFILEKETAGKNYSDSDSSVNEPVKKTVERRKRRN